MRTKGAMRHINLLRGVQRHKVPGEDWGEAPAANGFLLLFFGSMKHILGHKMRIIGDLWLDEPRGSGLRAKILGMRAQVPRESGPTKSAPTCQYGNYIRRPIPVASCPWSQI